MAKMTKAFTFDLCPTKPNPALMDLGDTSVTVNLTVETKKPIAPTLFDRAVKVGEAAAGNYTKIISEEVAKLERKVQEAVNAGRGADAVKMAAETTMSVKNACASLQAAIETAVSNMLKAEAQGDQNLLEARVIAGVKIGFKVIAIVKDVTLIGVSHGADVTAWISLAMNIKDLAVMIHDLTKGESTRRKELLTAIGKYTTAKQKKVIDEEKATTKGKKFVLIVKTVYSGGVKAAAEKAETSRKAYRNEVTAMRQHVDKLSLKAEELMKKAQAATTLKEGIQVGAKCMQIKTRSKTLNEEMLKCQAFADDMAMLLTEAGVKVSDATFKQKMSTLSGLKDLVPDGMELLGAAGDVLDIVNAIAG